MDSETPLPTTEQIDGLYSHVEIKDYLKRDDSAAIDYLDELVRDRITIKQFTKSSFFAELDGSLEDLSDLSLSDIVTGEDDDFDSDEFKNREFKCACDSVFKYGSDAVIHLYDVYNDEIKALIKYSLPATQLIELLFNYEFNRIEEQLILLKRFLKDNTIANLFINYLRSQSVIPPFFLEQYEKYNQ